MDDVTTSVLVGTGRGRSTLRLAWRRDDPLAVSVDVTAEPPHPALPRGRWSVLRDFLRYGLDEPTGDGDVRIRPDHAGARVVLELRGRGRPFTVPVPAATVREFLDATERIVPAGEERGDIDALIERLTRSA